MPDEPVMVITGTRTGIGRWLAHYYADHGYLVVGCSRKPADYELPRYEHVCLDVADEAAVRELFGRVRRTHGRLNALVANAGVAAMNHSLLTPLATVRQIFDTNVLGTFLFCREAARLMKPGGGGRIVTFASVATPLRLEGEAAYAASKAAVVSLTQILARELAELGITVNAVGPTPVPTELIAGLPRRALEALVQRQAIRRLGSFSDVANVIDFFLSPRSEFVTGQVVFLGGVS